MGRKRVARLDLPERVYFHHGAYYFVHASGKWEKLDRDYAKAMARWAQLLVTPTRCVTVGDLLDRYAKEVVPTKAERTQRDNLGEIRFLRAALGHMELAHLLPSDVALYRDSRSAKTRANREIALLSHALSKACEWGYINSNPCREVKRNKESARDRYVTDEELASFRSRCAEWMQRYIDLKALTGLRQQDLLALKWTDIDDKAISLTVQKTSRRLRITLNSEVREILAALPKRGFYVFNTRSGTPYTAAGFSSIWRRAMDKHVAAGFERFHEHDIRGKVATDMGDAAAAQKLLAHKSVKMTESYIKQRQTDEVAPLTRRKKHGP